MKIKLNTCEKCEMKFLTRGGLHGDLWKCSHSYEKCDFTKIPEHCILRKEPLTYMI